MTLGRIIPANASTFDPNGATACGPGELVTDPAGGANSRVGAVCMTAGGMKVLQLLVGDVNVSIGVTKPGAFTQRVTVTVTDRHADPIAGALVSLSVVADDPITALATGVVGKVVGYAVDSVDGQGAMVTLESGVAGTADVDLATAGAAVGEVYASATWPGPGRDSDTLAFTA